MSFCSKGNFMNYLLHHKTDRQQLDGSVVNMKEAHVQILCNVTNISKSSSHHEHSPDHFLFESITGLPMNVMQMLQSHNESMLLCKGSMCMTSALSI